MALSYYSSILFCAAVITLIGLDSCECAAAAVPPAPQPAHQPDPQAADVEQRNRALEQLFRTIDADGDGIIKMDELQNLQHNQEFRNLVRSDHRDGLIRLLENACGINIETFKALFNQHFQRPAVPHPPANEGPGVFQVIAGVINELVGDAINAVARAAAQARPAL